MIEVFQREIVVKIAKIYQRHYKIFFGTTGTILIKLDKRHPWVKEIEVCSNGRSQFFSGGIIATFTQIACKSMHIVLFMFVYSFWGERCKPWPSCFHAGPHYDTDFTKHLYFNKPYKVLIQNVIHIFLCVFNLGWEFTRCSLIHLQRT